VQGGSSTAASSSATETRRETIRGGLRYQVGRHHDLTANDAGLIYAALFGHRVRLSLSARRPASVICTRVWSPARPRSICAVARPARTISASSSTENPCANRNAERAAPIGVRLHAASQRDWRNKAIAAPRDIDNEPISITSVTQRAAQCRNMDSKVCRLHKCVRPPDNLMGRGRIRDEASDFPGTRSFWLLLRGHLPRLGAVALLIDFRFYELRQVSQRLLPAEVTRL
jgi:hypothetical protein